MPAITGSPGQYAPVDRAIHARSGGIIAYVRASVEGLDLGNFNLDIPRGINGMRGDSAIIRFRGLRIRLLL